MQLASGRHRILIDRIMQDGGHLSNDQSAAAVRELAPRRRVVLLHLSRQCNTPGTAVNCHMDAHGGGLHGAIVEAAPEIGPTAMIDLAPAARVERA
jgi:phosphoribosyl 1,2-cyclic phosphodiesterase